MINRRLIFQATEENRIVNLQKLRTEAKLIKRMYGLTAAKIGEAIELPPASVPVYFPNSVGNPFESQRAIRYGLYLRRVLSDDKGMNLVDFPAIVTFTDILCGGNYPNKKKWIDMIGSNEPLNYTKSTYIKAGKAIRMLRMLYGDTLKTVANDLGCSISAVRGFEIGKVCPSSTAGVIGIRYALLHGVEYVNVIARDFDNKELDYEEDKFFDFYDYICKLLCF